MSCVVYQYRPSGVYAYKSVSYRDPVTKKPKSKREYIGRVDPVTKELLDPERVAKWQEKRLKAAKSKETKPETSDSEKKSDYSQALNELKELIIQQQNEYLEIRKMQEETQSVLKSIAKSIQDTLH